MAGVLLLALSMYTYHATRVVAPLLLLGIWLDVTVELFIKEKYSVKTLFVYVRKKLGLIIFAGIIFSLLISPILISLHSVETQQRFSETSLFADGRNVTLSNKLIAKSNPTWLGKILYHRNVIGAQMILENYLSHFTFKFLFLSGDSNPRHSNQFVGLMYTGEILLLLAGLYFLISKRNAFVYSIFFWLAVGVLPAALTTATPHALRILPSLPAWILILTAGAYQMFLWCTFLTRTLLVKVKLSNQPYLPIVITLLCFVLFYGWEFTSYWRFYSLIYPKVFASEWQFGYKQMVLDLVQAQKENPTLPVQITREYGRPSTYYWFYTQTDPRTVQAEENTAKKDQGEYLQYQNIRFVDQVSAQQKTLIASSEESMNSLITQNKHVVVLSRVNDLENKVVWMIYTAE